MKFIPLILVFLIFSSSCDKINNSLISNNVILLNDNLDSDYTGSIIGYYSSGTSKKYETVYVSGLKTGKYRRWYKNGSVKEEGVFIKNKRYGVWKFYGVNGELEYAFNYNSKNQS